MVGRCWEPPRASTDTTPAGSNARNGSRSVHAAGNYTLLITTPAASELPQRMGIASRDDRHETRPAPLALGRPGNGIRLPGLPLDPGRNGPPLPGTRAGASKFEHGRLPVETLGTGV